MSFVCTWFCKLSLPWSYCKSVFRSNFAAAALKVTLVGWLRSFLNPRKSMLPYKSCLWKFLPFWLSYSKTYFLGNSAKIWDSCFFLFLSRKSFAPECTRLKQEEEELLQSLLLVSAWKIVKMKRALPSGEVAAASKLFEKFHAAEEFEDILYYHNELCNVLKICPGPLSSFYNVIKVQFSDFAFSRLK